MAILLICALLVSPSLACLGGGSGGGACCPPSAPVCAPSVPPCSSSSYVPAPAPAPVSTGCVSASGCGAGGSYAAPVAQSYAAAPAASYGASSGGYGASSGSYGGSYAAPASSYGAAGGSYSSYGASGGIAQSGYAQAASYPRPVATGYSQSAGVGYGDSAAPVVRKVITIQQLNTDSAVPGAQAQEAEQPITVEIVEPQLPAEPASAPAPEPAPAPESAAASASGAGGTIETQESIDAETPMPVSVVVIPVVGNPDAETLAAVSESAGASVAPASVEAPVASAVVETPKEAASAGSAVAKSTVVTEVKEVKETKIAETQPAAETAPAAAASGEYQSSIDNAYEEIASEEEATLKKQEKYTGNYEKVEKKVEISTAKSSAPAPEPVAAPEPPPPAPEVLAPEPPPPAPAQVPEPAPAVSQVAETAISETHVEYAVTAQPDPKPATLIESYQGYYEPTVAPAAAASASSEHISGGYGRETEQRVDVPQNSQSGEYLEESNLPEDISPEPEGGACTNDELKAIVEGALNSQTDNLEAARQIEGDASKKFGGRFNAIVSDSEFAYVNWYGKMNCQLRVGNRHSLTWED